MPGLRTWVGASTADIGIRLAAQMLSTVIIARILPPEDFGISLMVLTVVALASALIGLPVEEALARRRRLATAHLQTTFATSLALTAIAITILAALGPVLERVAGAPGLATWLLVASLFLIGQGPGALARALSRRQRRFVDLAACQSISVVVASAVSILAALGGWGVFALILQRMLPVVLYPGLVAVLAASRRQRVWIRAKWDMGRFRQFLRISGVHQADVGVRFVTPTLLTYLVNAHFGAVLLGELNIAMRMVEPLRSGIVSIGHNLVFSLLVPLQAQPRQLVEAAGRITVTIATLAVPAFLGLAATAPILLPLLVGSGWEDAIPLARLLCVGAAISVPLRYFFSAYSALGRLKWGLAGGVAGLVAMLVMLEASIALGLAHAAGLATIALDAANVGFGVVLALSLAGRSVATSMLQVGRIWIAAGAMAVVVAWLFPGSRVGANPVLWLVAAIATGMALYAVLLLLVCRPCLRRILEAIAPARASTL